LQVNGTAKKVFWQMQK